MATAVDAYNAIRARLPDGLILDALGAALEMRWRGDRLGPLPDAGTPFVFLEVFTDPAQIVAFGGGRGQNLHRNPARLDAWVFVPMGYGFANTGAIAETIAARFRSYRDTVISCFTATVYPGGEPASVRPPGMTSDVNNYDWALAEVDLFYDQVG